MVPNILLNGLNMTHAFLRQFLEQHPLMGIEGDMPALGNTAGIPIPDWIKDGPVYEIFVRQFSEAGTLKAVQEKLPDLKKMGIKTLWLMPIHPLGVKDRKGKLGSPYAIADYMAIDPALGTNDDFKALVTAVHRLEMRLILDLVVNHTANDHRWHHDHPDFYLYPEKNNKVRKVAEWSDITDLHYDNQHLRDEIAAVIRYWIEKFDIDGYRCDVAGLVPVDFWETVFEEVQKHKADRFMLAEWQSSRLHQRAFHAYYDWVLYWLMRDIRKGKRRAADIPLWLAQRRQLFPEQAIALQFTENHDYPRTAGIFGKKAFQPFAALTFLLPGLPLLYAGQEYGATKMPSLFEKDPLDRETKDEMTADFYQRLIRLSREFPVLRNGRVDFLRTVNHSLLLIKIYDEHKTLNAILNFSGKIQKVDYPPFHALYGTELLYGQVFDGAAINLQPWQVQILDLIDDNVLVI